MIWTAFGTGANQLPFVKLAPGHEGKTQSAKERGDAGKKRKNEGTRNTEAAWVRRKKLRDK